MFPFPFLLVNISSLILFGVVFSCSFQVFESPKVGSKARDKMITSREFSLSLLVFHALFH